MHLLVLGGTLFLGRHVVDAARARGHRVTLFNRGTRPVVWPGVEQLIGDRDGGLDVLDGRRFDAVVDTSGYVPRVVGASARRLAAVVDHYTFVSSASVYGDLSRPGTNETGAVATLDDPTSEHVRAHYGALKAACERAVDDAMPGRALHVRAGLIVGPLDATGRFGYWVRRVAEGGDVLAPGDPQRAIQFVDARDLSDWIVAMAEARTGGVFNATGPDRPCTMRALLDTCRETSGSAAGFTWVDEAFLEAHDVAPFTEMPLWLPASDAGLLALDVSRAIGHGLRFRPLADTVRDTLAWLRSPDRSAPPATLASGATTDAGLAPERERALLAAWRASLETSTGSNPMNLIDRIVQFQSDIALIRRDLHAHPELRFEEVRTADIVARKLAEWGYAVHQGLGKTGVVGTLKVGSGTKSVGLRADMDALPLQEHNAFAHRSQHDGCMHACGHDGHTAMLLAAAQYLAESRAFDGTLHLIFQPAEEGGGGARVMMEDGLFDLFPCDAVFGMHNWPGRAVGTFGVKAGPMMASSNEFEITIVGKGAHAAMPHDGVDPIMTAVAIAQALQTLITRNKKPVDTAVLSITQIHAGDAYNVIPNEAVLRGTIRTFSTAVLDAIESGMQRIVDGSAATFGSDVTLRFERKYPPTVNHVAETAFCADVMRDVVGADAVKTDIEPTMGAEDFAFMLQARPGCYVFIGNGDGDHRESGHGMGPCMLHNPSYDFNDALIPIGATYWVRLAEKFLAPT